MTLSDFRQLHVSGNLLSLFTHSSSQPTNHHRFYSAKPSILFAMVGFNETTFEYKCYVKILNLNCKCLWKCQLFLKKIYFIRTMFISWINIHTCYCIWFLISIILPAYCLSISCYSFGSHPIICGFLIMRICKLRENGSLWLVRNSTYIFTIKYAFQRAVPNTHTNVFQYDFTSVSKGQGNEACKRNYL